jgi:hypothetical protein
MNLIDVTYFAHDPIKIKGVESSNGFSNELTNERCSELERAIAINEPKYLKMLLGEDLYVEYVASFEDIKWDALKAKLVDPQLLRSPIANYTYYEFMKQRKFATGDIGSYIPKAENMTLVDPNYVLKQAWNDGVEQSASVCKWLYEYALEQGWTNEVENSQWTLLLTRQSLFA